MTALLDQIKAAKDIPEALEVVDQWMSALLYDAQYANVHSTVSPEILQDAEFSHGQLFHAHFKDSRSLYWFSEQGVHAMAQAIKNVAGQLRAAAPPTTNSIQGEAPKSTHELADVAIKQYETDIADMDSTISFLMGMYWDIVAGVREYPEADQDALHKELGAASRWESPEDGSASTPSTVEHQRFCRWLRERLRVGETQAISITEHKTALNAAHDEIAKLKAEIAALKAAPPSPPPSDPLTTAYTVIGELVVKQRGG